jgi:hypothetical protein
MSVKDITNLTVLTEEINNFKIENGAFGGFSDEICVPYGVRRIAPLALAPLKDMKRLVLPETIERFEPSDLRKPYDTSTKSHGVIWGINTSPQSLKDIHISDNHPLYRSKNGVLYSADGKQLIYLPPYHYGETLEITEGVEELCEESCCFVDATVIFFPKTLRRVLDKACCSSNMKKSEIPSCELGMSAFQGCVLPEYTDIYNEVIPAKAFANCSNVKGIYLHDSVKLVKDEAFSYTDMEKIYIPSTTQIEENAFVREESRWVESHVVKVHENGWKRVENTYEYYLENYKDMIIGGEAGSPAEAFANTNGINFEVVGSSEEEIKAWLGLQECIDAKGGTGVFYKTPDGKEVEYDPDDLPF